ncbi:yjeF C-terminal region, hydroxyethylthiazole kinase-related/yjeF N-terminal region [Celeribacter baekdonensis]|uniref:Bifunctional NAD(P)H-hydrate repair enzyme n=1 Tax=Celeribacter baekdonensis TaxID=875171 RepID=A0A1G7G7D0_9RHOB|nr:bifunctional ADP-dependent NAD(P)H-hydrate dehydratase/NAD(P)H-hydrate epimerase [Celeribacter baekdonensis]SDE84022.1 yjeF C-terminal region, hydroxyethylthiazole kinase-related/yjeF N-terminal region [Celeribacter baekdonensis]
MTELLTSAQMRAIEQAAIASGSVTGLTLMERAGQGVVDAILKEWPELALTAHKAVVLCGPGNNGGDGFVVARLLKQRGWEVEVFLYGDPEKLPPDARANYKRWGELGAVLPCEDDTFDGAFPTDDPPSIVVDALLGTGLTRPFLSFRHLSMLLNTCQSQWKTRRIGPRVVAVDVPSGLCADSGKWLGDDQPLDFANVANLTVSFHAKKLGHVLANGPQCCGKTVVADIGLRHAMEASHVLSVEHGSQPNFLTKRAIQHKYTHGHALILSGPSGKTGAARLAARAALRVGAGLVTLGTAHDALFENAAQLTAIMLTEIDGVEALTETLKDSRINALCIGPGFGVERAGAVLPVLLAAKRPTVLDADALTALSQDEGLFAALHPGCVLTPHAGEFKRLFPDLTAKLDAPATTGPAYSKLDATREAAKRAGCVVLFKGPDTVIAAPDGRATVNAAVYERAAPWLATAGSGDVLAGIITGLLARGFSPHRAAETGAWLHTEAARSFGPGLIAEDLPEELPKVFRQLGL